MGGKREGAPVPPVMKLLLASTSPRRRELLTALGVSFEIASVPVEELVALTAAVLTPADLARANARLKAEAVGVLHPGRWVLGADTVVACEGWLFGKPGTIEEARGFLRKLGGRTHEVITGCALLGPDGAEEIFHEISHVSFRPLDNPQIDRYLTAVPVLDKAGGYALQEHGEWIVAGVRGSRDNVVGLPTERLAPLLRSRGLL